MYVKGDSTMQLKCINAEKMNLEFGNWTQDKAYEVIDDDASGYFVEDNNKTTWWVEVGESFEYIFEEDLVMEKLDTAAIVRSYNGASNKVAQLRILSELYACKPDDIRKVLTDAGVTVINKPGRKIGSKNTAKDTVITARDGAVGMLIATISEPKTEPKAEEKVDIELLDNTEYVVDLNTEPKIEPVVEEVTKTVEDPEIVKDAGVLSEVDPTIEPVDEKKSTQSYSKDDTGILVNGTLIAVDKATLIVFADMLRVFQMNKRVTTNSVKEASSNLIKAIAKTHLDTQALLVAQDSNQLDEQSAAQLDAGVAELDALLK